jgi:hypothetical protein
MNEEKYAVYIVAVLDTDAELRALLSGTYVHGWNTVASDIDAEEADRIVDALGSYNFDPKTMQPR